MYPNSIFLLVDKIKSILFLSCGWLTVGIFTSPMRAHLTNLGPEVAVTICHLVDNRILTPCVPGVERNKYTRIGVHPLEICPGSLAKIFTYFKQVMVQDPSHLLIIYNLSI